MKKISELVLHNDHHLLALNKPNGMPSQEDPTGDPSAHRLAMAYAHRDLHLVHRLDRRVSGILLLAKNKAAAADLSAQWNADAVTKTYLAIVPQQPMDESGEVTHYLSYDKGKNTTIAHTEKEDGRDEARMSYKVLHQLDQYMVLQIQLHTGRKHQLRAQLSALGIPVRGDIKYGSKRTNADGGIDLHAWSLAFQHPTKKTNLKIIAPVPDHGLWPEIDPKVIESIK